ncbi:MAG: DUF4286 family protein [Breznakibacter sp.]
MFIYNTTFVVGNNRINQWKGWLNGSYFPAIEGLMVTQGVEVFEVMSIGDDVSSTFSVQWRCLSSAHMEDVIRISTEILASLPSVFGEECLHFSSILRQFSTE